MARQKDRNGSSYSSLNLASFRGSSELEYGADSAFLFDANRETGLVTMKCEKNRFGDLTDIVAAFDPRKQSFAVPPSGLEGFGAGPSEKGEGGPECG